MKIKQVVWGSVFAVLLLGPVAVFADTISGTAGDGFRSWTTSNLNQNGKPYWDNPSLDGSNMNIGFLLTDTPSAPLPGAPGALPFWGNSFNSGTDSGGLADLNFVFNKNSASSIASMQLEVAANSNINQFGWYNVGDTNDLHTIFAAGVTPLATQAFDPSGQYGFYLIGSNGTFFTQSSLNTGGTSQQHFTVFEQSLTSGAEVYWLGIEDLNVHDQFGGEGGAGDYNDMIIKISSVPVPAVPEPSTVMLVLSGTMLMLGLRKRQR
jgi:hypothetical protein